MPEDEPNLDDGLVPGTPEVPVQSQRRSPILYDPDRLLHDQLSVFWDETPFDRFLLITAAFGLTLLVGFLIGWALAQSTCR